MTSAITAANKAALITALKLIYGPGELSAPGSPVSNGRGGFTTSVGTPVPIYAQREETMSELASRNIAPDRALIFILATDGVAPKEGQTVTLTPPDLPSDAYNIHAVSTDPVGAVFECECSRA